VITIVAFGATLLRWSAPVGALVLLAAVPTLVAQVRLARLRGEMLEQTAPLLRRQSFYAALLLDMRAAKEIRLFGLGAFFGDRMLRELRAAQRHERRQDRLALRVDGALAALTGLVSLVALAVFAGQVADGRGSVGDLVVVVAALGALQLSVSGLVHQVAMLGQTMMMFGHYADLTEAATPARRSPLPAAPPLREGLEFDDVWFRYAPEHDWVLRGLTLRIPRGTSLALVGDNGAGKSTLVKLLCGFYTPVRGEIRWDGVDIATYDPASLRARIGATFQDFMTYEFSAHDNIALGDLAALDDRPRVRAAAGAAGVDEALGGLPRGYETMLTRAFRDDDAGGVGVVLSGGQWQRVALARAARRAGADLLILDEPSAGLVVEAEHEVHRRLAALRQGRTSLLISHRLNTLRDADPIAVLRGGAIDEQGTHADLKAAGGRYAELVRLQASGDDDGEVPA
jgi:ATP-binding cassette subfamily B protein